MLGVANLLFVWGFPNGLCFGVRVESTTFLPLGSFHRVSCGHFDQTDRLTPPKKVSKTFFGPSGRVLGEKLPRRVRLGSLRLCELGSDRPEKRFLGHFVPIFFFLQIG